MCDFDRQQQQIKKANKRQRIYKNNKKVYLVSNIIEIKC